MLFSDTEVCTPAKNMGVIRGQAVIAEKSYDLSKATVREADTVNYDCSQSSIEGEEDNFSPEKFLAALAASNFREVGEAYKETHANDLVCTSL